MKGLEGILDLSRKVFNKVGVEIDRRLEVNPGYLTFFDYPFEDFTQLPA